MWRATVIVFYARNRLLIVIIRITCHYCHRETVSGGGWLVIYILPGGARRWVPRWMLATYAYSIYGKHSPRVGGVWLSCGLGLSARLDGCMTAISHRDSWSISTERAIIMLGWVIVGMAGDICCIALLYIICTLPGPMSHQWVATPRRRELFHTSEWAGTMQPSIRWAVSATYCLPIYMYYLAVLFVSTGGRAH